MTMDAGMMSNHLATGEQHTNQFLIHLKSKIATLTIT